MKTKICAAAALGFALAASSPGQGTLDSFDTQQFVIVPLLPGATNANSVAAPEALGGERDLRVHRVGGSVGTLIGDVGYVFPNTVSLSCGLGVIGSMHLVYDGPDNSDAVNATGLGGIDLTEGGTYNAIRFATTSDLGAKVTITVYQDATHYSVASINVAADPTFTFVDTVIGMSQFVPAGPDGGASFSNVGALEFEIGDGPEGADISLRIIGRVHDPKFDPPPPPTSYDFAPKTQGYWKNHAAVWPVDSLTLGAVAYTQDELLAILGQPTKGDASMILAHQLIAAKLNIASNADPTDIADAIAAADSLLASFPGILPFKVAKTDSRRPTMISVAGELDAFNNSGE
ncbi:MAG TPA: hypothetical protein PLU30_19570 [Verrucomicrobiae bacterium]|nr:hypothetical protein [Verrucomicrobiae bacterium]